MRTILLIMLGLSSLLNADLTRTSNTVTDSETGLEWLDDETAPQQSWKDAITYCEEKNVDGRTDWRLPNINELSTLLYSENIDDTFKYDFLYNYYWSSTTNAKFSSDAWIIYYFGNGNQMNYGKYSKKDVRCVREG